MRGVKIQYYDTWPIYTAKYIFRIFIGPDNFKVYKIETGKSSNPIHLNEISSLHDIELMKVHLNEEEYAKLLQKLFEIT